MKEVPKKIISFTEHKRSVILNEWEFFQEHSDILWESVLSKYWKIVKIYKKLKISSKIKENSFNKGREIITILVLADRTLDNLLLFHNLKSREELPNFFDFSDLNILRSYLKGTHKIGGRILLRSTNLVNLPANYSPKKLGKIFAKNWINWDNLSYGKEYFEYRKSIKG